MRLTLKLAAAVFVGLFTVMIVNIYLGIQLQVSAWEKDAARDQKVLATAIAVAAGSVWQRHGKTEALRVIEAANERDPSVHIRWVNLAVPRAELDAPSFPITFDMLSDEERVIEIVEDEGGERSMYSYTALHAVGDALGAIEIEESMEDQDKLVSALARLNAIGSIAMTLVAMGLGLFFGKRWVGVPVQNLIEAARRVSEGDLSAQSTVRGKDEIAKLSGAMNSMIASLGRAMEQLRHADRMNTAGELSSGVAHELGTPLHVVLGRAKAILTSDECTDRLRKNAEVIVRQADKMSHIIRQLLTFAHAKHLNKRPTNILGIVEETMAMVDPMARNKQVEMSIARSQEALLVDVDPTQIQQVFANLLINAIQASQPHTEVKLSLERVAEPAAHRSKSFGLEEGDYVVCSIQDKGQGIDEESLDQIFEPFFTTKEVGKGTGLGLSIAQGIVRGHGGLIRVTSSRGAGSCFAVYLPTAT